MKPDIVVTKGVGKKLREYLEDHGIKTFIVNEDDLRKAVEYVLKIVEG